MFLYMTCIYMQYKLIQVGIIESVGTLRYT